MLDKDPARRIGIKEIFEHPWISRYKNNKKQRDRGIFGNIELIDEIDIIDKLEDSLNMPIAEVDKASVPLIQINYGKIHVDD